MLLTVLWLWDHWRGLYKSPVVTVLFGSSLRRLTDVLPPQSQWSVRQGALGCLLALLNNRFLFLGAALFRRLVGSVQITQACAVLECDNWPSCPSGIALLFPLRGKKDQILGLFGPGGPLCGFPRSSCCQIPFLIRTVHNDPSVWGVGCTTKTQSQLSSTLLGLIQALQRGKNTPTVVQGFKRAVELHFTGSTMHTSRTDACTDSALIPQPAQLPGPSGPAQSQRGPCRGRCQ